MNSVVYCCVADIQTPDFSNVVMESLDRVGQIEGSQLVAGGDSMQQQQQQPFPVMLHTNAGIPSSTMSSSAGQVPGPSSDPRSTTSTSGGRFPFFLLSCFVFSSCASGIWFTAATAVFFLCSISNLLLFLNFMCFSM